jgi:2-polyprenyl-6-methoxyphenol hydroxylase-like FAD-dependent oxidoreductase
VDALPESLIHLGHDFVAYQQDLNEIRVNFANHSSISCHALIGADGLHSQVRGQMFDDTGPIYRGYTVWRGITSCVPKELETATAIEIHGRGQRFGIGPVGHGRIGWWASANEVEQSEAEPDEQQKLVRLFSGWWSPVRQLIETTPAAGILRNQAFDRDATASWGIGRVTLLGDAIHATTPNLGQGGCMAVEDAAVLARCLAETSEPAQAFRAYERVRYERTAAITDSSRLYGRVGQWESSAGAWSRRVMLSLIPEVLTRQMLKVIFDYDAFTVRI